MILMGRRKIYTDEKSIDQSNIISVLRKAYPQHCQNALEMEYLINYEKGYQPLPRQKIVRPEIDIQVQDNLANMITDFKVGYVWGKPITLVQKGDKDLNNSNPEKDDSAISMINEMLLNGEEISAVDQAMANYIEIGGIGHRMIDIKKDYDGGSYVDVFTLNSLFTFCVYRNDATQKKLLAVSYRVSQNRGKYLTCFTDKERFEIHSDKIDSVEKNPLGMIPIVEYERSFDRMGCFERQISDMDNLNVLVSDFANDAAQKTQELWWGNDFEFPSDEITGKPRTPVSGQWVMTSSGESKNPKIQAISSTFDGESTLNNISQRRGFILEKCKVPLQSDPGGGSTGTAMSMSSGWSSAEVDACREEQMIKKGKREELKLILKAIEKSPYVPADSPMRSLKYTDVDFHFERNKNYDMSIKANTFATYIKCGIHGRHALKVTDAFSDIEQVWVDSKDMIEKYQKSLIERTTNEEKRIMGDNSDQIGNSPILDGMNTDNN